MYERLIKDYGSRGSAAEIWIDKDARLVKKYYKVNGIGCMGKTIVENDYAKLKELWTNEITWNSKFGKFSVPIVDYGDLGDSFFVVQEYYAPDLLVNYMNKTLHQDYPDIKQQVIEFFEMCKDLNVYKYNH